MARIRLDMTMSLDGYVAGPRDSVDEPMGVGGFRLFNWLDRRDDPGPNRTVYRELMATRAVVSGRRTYEHAGRWQGDHHDGVPIFVLTREVPDEPPPGSVRYVTDVDECAAQARAAAGGGDVMVHGAGAGQALLRAGQLDELELHVVPVLLGQGRRLFDDLGRTTSSSTWSAS
jgi:dihydrofolate reductase